MNSFRTEVSSPPDGEAVGRYGFVHALYRHVLYERLSASRRVQLHRRIGERGEALYRERAGEIAAELAMHFERAAHFARAAKYLQQAAENAIRRFAYQEAVVLARHGLELLARSPDGAEREQQELRLQVGLGVSLIATEGYAAPGVGAVYLNARQLCHRMGEPPEVSQVLWGLWTFHTLGADLETALEIAREFLRLAEQRPSSDLAMRGHWAMGITFTHLGECALTLEHFDTALLLYRPRSRDDAFLYAPNPGVAIRCFGAWSLWALGRPDQSLTRNQDALALARETSEPHSLAHALLSTAILHQLRREPQQARDHAEAAIAVSTAHGLVMYLAMATITRGWAGIEPGREEEAIDEMRRGLAALQTTGAQLMRPHFLALLAAALEKAGRADEGLRVLEEALAIALSTGERFYEAELYRLKGELLLAQASSAADAEGCFNQSLETARRQKAQALELRAVMSLARLHHNQGKANTALELLSRTYGRFTEGLATPDLRDAEALLSELSVRSS